MAEALSRMSLFSPCGSMSKFSPDFSRSSPFFTGTSSRSSYLLSSRNGFFGKRLLFESRNGTLPSIKYNAVPVEMALSIGKSARWWVKEVHPNMKEIASAQDLVDTLLSAGDKLVIVDFFSPGCGGCKSLHPKICQFAEKNPDVIFLQMNYEEHKSMCYSLNVHVLPFFRFYRGSQGRLCSFSCTIATIKKFRDALAKTSTAKSDLGPAKGLEESELLSLAANKDVFFSYPNQQLPAEIFSSVMNPTPSISELIHTEAAEMALATAGR